MTKSWAEFQEWMNSCEPESVWVRAWWRAKHFPRKAYWWIRHRTTDKYHVVNTGLRPGYNDIDVRLEEAMYSLLKEYVEKELGGINVLRDIIQGLNDAISSGDQVVELSYGSVESAQADLKRHKDIEKLYVWCTKTRPVLMEKRCQHDDEWYEMDKLIRGDDTEMLKLLVEIRGCLWT